MKTIRYKPVDFSSPIEINLSSSKSISNRALLLQALSKHKFALNNISDADDTKLMLEALSGDCKTINLKNAGTCMRFLTAYFSCIENKEIMLQCDERMKQRPIKNLVDSLKELGAEIIYLEEENFPSLKIIGKKLIGKNISINASQSSQFVSALMLIAPFIENGLTIDLVDEISSKSYIEMTADLMNNLGFEVLFSGSKISIKQQKINSTFNQSNSYSIEPDWSSAAFWFQVVALNSDIKIFLKNLSHQSIQGDKIIENLMKRFSVHSSEIIFNGTNGILIENKKSINSLNDISINFTSNPDLVPVYAVTCAALNLKTNLIGLKNLKIKESDRLVAINEELNNLGFETQIVNDELQINNTLHQRFNMSSNQIMNTRKDHRIAMAFAPLVFLFDEIKMNDTDVVIKSYPDFWLEAKKVGIELV